MGTILISRMSKSDKIFFVLKYSHKSIKGFTEWKGEEELKRELPSLKEKWNIKFSR